MLPSLSVGDDLAVSRAEYRLDVTSSIHGWSRLHLPNIYNWMTAGLAQCKLTSQCPSITVDFSVQYKLKMTSAICIST